MKKNKFRFLVLTLVVCAGAISVSTQETESKSTPQSSIKKTVSQPSANQLFQPTQIAQRKYAPFKTLNLASNGIPRRFSFAMPKSNLALQIEGLEEGPPLDWGCYLACRAAFPDLHPLVCFTLCILN